MSFVFRCPTCQTAIADVPGPGVVDATCSRCRYAYRVTTGPVDVANTREAAVVRYGTPTGEHEREYDLRIRPTPGTVEIASFRRPTGDAPISVGAGDLVSLAHTLRGTAPGNLAVVVNHTAQQTHVLARPGDLWMPHGAIAYAGILAAGLAVTYASGSAFPFLLALVAVMVFAIVAEHGPQQRRLDPADVDALQGVEKLLDQKQKLGARQHERKDTLAERLRALRQKMEAVGEEHYGTRMRIVDAGLRVLDQQLETEQKLLAQYERTHRLLEIEIESRTLLAGVADTDAGAVQDAMDELDALSAAHEALQHRLAANEEVERLLRP
jgi:hypothetical protein